MHGFSHHSGPVRHRGIVYKEERKEENVVDDCEKRGSGEEEPITVDCCGGSSLPPGCRDEPGWSAGECWLQVKLSFPVRIVCGPSTRGETAARSSAGR